MLQYPAEPTGCWGGGQVGYVYCITDAGNLDIWKIGFVHFMWDMMWTQSFACRDTVPETVLTNSDKMMVFIWEERSDENYLSDMEKQRVNKITQQKLCNNSTVNSCGLEKVL